MTEPSTKTLRAELEAALSAGETGRALDRLHSLWSHDPTAATATVVLRAVDRLRPAMSWAVDQRIHVLRSFTIEPMIPLLRAEAALHGLSLQVELGELGTHVQSIVDPSSRLYTSSPDVVVLALLLRDVAPELAEGFADLDEASVAEALARAERELASLVSTLRERSRARILVHGLELPDPPANGVLDVSLRPSQHEAVRSLQRTLVDLARSHHDVYVVDVEQELARVGTERAHDPTKWLTMRMPYRAEGLLALARAWTRRLVPMTSRAAKCVVVDLDHTLWGGILGEDGLDGLHLGVEHPGAAHRNLQRTLRDLMRRGLMLAVASKNDADEALRAIDTHPEMLLRSSDFAALQIHWRPKHESLVEIARALGIGLDALVFVDDNPVERASIRETLPMVHVVDLGGDPMRYAARVAQHPSVERLALSTEDRGRSALLAADRAREALASGVGTLDDFHRSLGMRIEWGTASPATLERIAQLTQKTNQFNLTTLRRSTAEIAALAANENILVRYARVRDRFGDNGLVGVAISTLEGQAATLDTFLMSCRVIGRTVETAMLAKLAADLRARGVTTLRARYRPTSKNGPAADFLRRHGFEAIETEADSSVLHRADVSALPSLPPWFEDEAVAGHGP